MNMKIYSIGLLLVCISTFQSVWAQKRTHQMLYLKNGSMIRSVRLVNQADSLLEVHTTEGSVLYLSATDVVKTERHRPVFMTKGWRGGIEWGLGLGKTYAVRDRESDTDTQRMVSFSLRGGYQWNRHWLTTLGIGADAHTDITFWPLSMRASYLFLHRRFTPVLSMEAGYGFRSKEIKTTQNWGIPQERHAIGGLMLNPSAGVWIRTSQRTSLVVSAGYRQQTYYQYFSDTQNDTRTQQVITVRRFFVSTGWVF